MISAAYQFGYPLFEQARLTYEFSYTPERADRHPVNTFVHGRKLTGFNEQKITTPNNDTLYSSAAIDLSAGPVRLQIPDFGSRYYSISFFDAYTNVFSCISTRLHGDKGRRCLLLGPGWTGLPNPGEMAIRAPGNHVVALARIQADGPQDYEEVHSLQNRLVMYGLTIPAVRQFVPPKPDDPCNFVAVVNQILRENPTLHSGCMVMENLAKVGIGPDEGPLSGVLQQKWYDLYCIAKSRLIDVSQRFGAVVDGWEYSPFNIASFGDDYESRAVIALKGFWANIPAEQMYTFAIADQSNQPLVGSRKYRLRLPKERAQDGHFWSLSIYERNKIGQLFFRDNTLHRYAIKSGDPHLVSGSDDSVEFCIQESAPDFEGCNWLPAPPGEFVLVMRVYMPKDPRFGTHILYPAVEHLPDHSGA